MKLATVLSSVPSTKAAARIEKAVLNVGYAGLFSLIGGLRQKEFGMDTMLPVALDIRKYRREFTESLGKTFFIDSGGYSFIKGDVHPSDVRKMLDCYHAYLVEEKDHYDRIFSLDLPVNLGYPECNTKANIEKWNRESLLRTRETLETYPDIGGKLHFVWQFKMVSQHDIWDSLYTELELGKVIQNRAVVGMVGLAEATKIQFSPFIGIAYRCLFDHLEGAFAGQPFRLHFLGIFSLTDRFTMALLEALFQRYGVEARFTYDTINYSVSVRKRLKNLPVFRFSDGSIARHTSLSEAPGEVFDHVYADPVLRDEVRTALEDLACGVPVGNTDVFSPINVYSNVAIDRYFECVVEEQGLAAEIMGNSSFIPVRRRITEVMKSLSMTCPALFSSVLAGSFMNSVEIVWPFHRWFVDRRDLQGLRRMNHELIKQIGFPGDLT